MFLMFIKFCLFTLFINEIINYDLYINGLYIYTLYIKKQGRDGTRTERLGLRFVVTT